MRAIKVQTDDAASLDAFLEIVDSTSNATVKSRTLNHVVTIEVPQNEIDYLVAHLERLPLVAWGFTDL